MPALIQRAGVILVGGEVAGGADGTFAVAHLDQGDQSIIGIGVVGKVGEIAERGAGMVELADGLGHGGQSGIVVLQSGGLGLVVRLGTALPAGGIEGVHVAQTVGPGHLEAIQANEVLVGHIGGSLMAQLPLRGN